MIYLVLAAVLLASPSWAAITCTGESFSFPTPSDPQAQDYTVPSVTNGITLVFANVRNSARTVSAATIGGNALTEIGSVITSTNTASQVFYRLNVTAGVQSISINWDAVPLSYVLTAVTCGDVHQSSPIASTTTATGSGTTITVDCSSAAGQLVLDFAGIDAAAPLTVGAGQTMLDQDEADGTLASGASYEAGAATVTMSHTAATGDWTTRCVALAAATAATTRRAAPLVFQ